ncbi:prolyl-tRNA synthetase [Methylacidimicrobium cyclopophantes]|uniref:Proline--tRNA ligase n=1 Tax=Methylacidimicrobium cyclopophantes TaxID=1041766 RepID=A0A5E6M8U8_9BACT|nr:proline--tRNA ligase [Methylacidimicrobium cyclopophantes]VVM05626.1 prolyl-tRNA synthetase [Methylacidimicrobium cyclopophantes]
MTERPAISPTRQEDFPEWYQQVIAAADLAENSEVRGCMIIKPWGYAIWERMQRELDRRIKAAGHRNAYFPLFIPLSFLEKEAEHVEGFAKECAVVTHHRLEATEGRLVPGAPLAEPLVVRPTSETIIGAAFARWIQSYRDLPLRINQWANVVRWELRPRLFLRTSEFLWQEGHTAHQTAAEAEAEALRMLRLYEGFLREMLALPAIAGEKTPGERFPGAVRTLTLEALVQDRKAIQAGTSHFLGQNFARANGITFLSPEGMREHVWTTSWGVSTRLVGTLIMAHSDDNGLVLPPRVAPCQIVLLPLIRREEERTAIEEACARLAAELAERSYAGEPLRVEIDARPSAGGAKNWEWVKKGVPLRVEIGPREVAAGTLSIGRRDRPPRERLSQSVRQFVAEVEGILTQMQEGYWDRAVAFQKSHTRRIASREEFLEFFTPRDAERPEIHGGFAEIPWSGDAALEEKIREEQKVTIRCIPLDQEPAPGTCPFSGKPGKYRVLFGKAY